MSKNQIKWIDLMDTKIEEINITKKQIKPISTIFNCIRCGKRFDDNNDFFEHIEIHKNKIYYKKI